MSDLQKQLNVLLATIDKDAATRVKLQLCLRRLYVLSETEFLEFANGIGRRYGPDLQKVVMELGEYGNNR